jgi:hypothetical protein
VLEPVTLLSYVAAITTKLKLGTSVILLTLRNPIQLASLRHVDDEPRARVLGSVSAALSWIARRYSVTRAKGG